MNPVRTKSIALTFAPLLLLAACASLSEDECRVGDWQTIGYEDGVAGRAAGFLSSHAKACAEFGIVPDPKAWQRGRQDGLTLYCQPRRAFTEGSKGRVLKNVCPITIRPGLQRENQRGLALHRITQEIGSLERQIRQITSTLSALAADDPSRVALIQERAAIRLEILTLRTERSLYL